MSTQLNTSNRGVRKVKINYKNGKSGLGELIGYDMDDPALFCVKVIDPEKRGPGKIKFFHKSELEELENGN